MDLYNPYDRPEASAEFPFFLGVIYVITLLLLIAAVYLLVIRPKTDHPLRKQIPEWAFSAAYPTFFLTLPFVMLVTVMILFPCWIKDCP